jgi:hypothetical protein
MAEIVDKEKVAAEAAAKAKRTEAEAKAKGTEAEAKQKAEQTK